MPENQEIVIVDICGTLYHSNTTFDFLDFTMKGKRYLFFRRCSKTLVWRIINRILLSTLTIDLTRIIAVHFLNGKTRKELRGLVDRFFTERLDLVKQMDVWSLISELKAKGARMILASATLDCIAEKVSEETGIMDYYATKLVYHNDVCLGKIGQDLLRNKKKILESMQICPPYNAVITDNFWDMDLISQTQNPVIVTKEKDLPKWKSLLKKNRVHSYDIILV